MSTAILILAGIVGCLITVYLCCGNGRKKDHWGSPRDIVRVEHYGPWSVSYALDWFIGCDCGADVTRLI